ncbi:MAG: hypothetical protein M5U26_07715 [Planctomycetota bacterium]|nr:hypothetical protein [Planctomycetota bacterium]
MLLDLDGRFPRYTDFEPAVPVWCLTPDASGLTHRFFDTSPLSPSGRYLALTRLAREDRLPEPGDMAEVVVVDLAAGAARTVAQTRGADAQLGAQVQWGASDAELFFNDLDTATRTPYGVKLDPATGARTRLGGTVYMLSYDGTRTASPCLLRTGLTQAGYGVVAPDARIPRNRGAAEDDGLWLAGTDGGPARLLLSFRRIAEEALGGAEQEAYRGGAFYGFHAKWNPQDTRLMFVVRWLPDAPGLPMKANLVTCDAGGSDVRLALGWEAWGRGGHHPNWCPDGERILMNLKADGQTMRFVSFRCDGSDLRALGEPALGSGHPTLHPNGRLLVTDAYLKEPMAYPDGSVPIRAVDAQTGAERVLARIPSRPAFYGPKGELRVDPHPAWDRSFRYVVFNGAPDGTRRVYLADLAALL